MKKTRRGSNFDDFLEEEGLRAKTEAAAIKRVIAYRIELEMKKAKLSKSEMAEKMRTSRSALDRLLDPANHAANARKGSSRSWEAPQN